MKIKIFSAIVAFGLTTIVSCKKEDPIPTIPTPQTEQAQFIWKEDGGSEIIADSCYWTTGTWGTGIRAYKGGMAKYFEINWDGFENTSVGTKVLSVSNYGFTFLDGSSNNSISTDQSIAITSISNNKISGNFNVTVSGGNLTTIQGTFTNINQKL